MRRLRRTTAKPFAWTLVLLLPLILEACLYDNRSELTLHWNGIAVKPDILVESTGVVSLTARDGIVAWKGWDEGFGFLVLETLDLSSQGEPRQVVKGDALRGGGLQLANRDTAYIASCDPPQSRGDPFGPQLLTRIDLETGSTTLFSDEFAAAGIPCGSGFAVDASGTVFVLSKDALFRWTPDQGMSFDRDVTDILAGTPDVTRILDIAPDGTVLLGRHRRPNALYWEMVSVDQGMRQSDRTDVSVPFWKADSGIVGFADARLSPSGHVLGPANVAGAFKASGRSYEGLAAVDRRGGEALLVQPPEGYRVQDVALDENGMLYALVHIRITGRDLILSYDISSILASLDS